MKAYIGIKYHQDHKNRNSIESISAALRECGFEPICIVRDLEQWGRVQFKAKELMHKTFDVIDSSQVAVIDLSEKGVGLGIEAGYAFAKGIPVVTIAKRGADISTTLRGISCEIFWYDDFSELVEFFDQIRYNYLCTTHQQQDLRES